MKRYTVIITLLFLCSLFFIYNLCSRPTPKPTVITDTITEVQFDTVYLESTHTHVLNHYHTVTDTIIDTSTSDTITIVRVDTIPTTVEVPIYRYRFDTSSIYLSISGFDVSLDTLIIRTPQTPWYKHIVPAIGVGINTSGQVGLFAGIGYTF